ncbi:pro-opiomelanocortin-like [Melanotaenia boesemani]|uniref:pro-opiomelanocortin-like n=1 Tax=Melanotaenia boesemani TaxID=1250792 RepID=UPI001C040654|nr:pro-opiomelanocortin-like [Melanotaenia boesemani]
MRPVLLLVAAAAAAAVGVVRGACAQCSEHPSCQELDLKGMMDCIQLCGSDVSGMPENVHPQPPPSSDPPSLSPLTSSSSPQSKDVYSMEHFRWGKPAGRKRRQVKTYTTYTTNPVDESAKLFLVEAKKRELSREMIVAKDEEKVVQNKMEQTPVGAARNSKYKMKHFRWSMPLSDKRYGGFMKSWAERSQRPLLNLFKNVINKEEPTEKREQ